MGCSGSVSLGPKLSLVLNRARTPGALSSAVVVRNVEARDEESPTLTNRPETKIRKLTSLSCHLKKR